MTLCRDSGLLDVIVPELKAADGIGGLPAASADDIRGFEASLHMLHLLDEPRFELALAALLHMLPAEPTVRDICLRLKLSNEEKDRTVWLVAHQDDLRAAPEFSLAQLKRALSHPYADDQLKLLHVRLLADGADLHPVLFCQEYLANTPLSEINPPPLIDGGDLIQLGLKPGPQFKTLLDEIRDAQLNGEITTKDEALEMAQKKL
jgi:poly(A) polymerase